MTTQTALETVGGRTAAAGVRLMPGEYVTAAPMRGAPGVRLMVLAVAGGSVEAAPHAGGTAVTVCLRGACEASPGRAARCSSQSGAWHPIPAPVVDGLF